MFHLFIARPWYRTVLLLSLFALSACGGGGGGADPTKEGSSKAEVTLKADDSTLYLGDEVVITAMWADLEQAKQMTAEWGYKKEGDNDWIPLTEESTEEEITRKVKFTAPDVTEETTYTVVLELTPEASETGGKESFELSLKVNPLPTLTLRGPEFGTERVARLYAGGKMELVGTVNGAHDDENISYQWFKASTDTSSESTEEELAGKTEATLALEGEGEGSSLQSGVYKLVASYSRPTALSQTYTVEVVEPTLSVQGPEGKTQFRHGDDPEFTLDVGTFITDAAGLTYSWFVKAGAREEEAAPETVNQATVSLKELLGLPSDGDPAVGSYTIRVEVKDDLSGSEQGMVSVWADESIEVIYGAAVNFDRATFPASSTTTYGGASFNFSATSEGENQGTNVMHTWKVEWKAEDAADGTYANVGNPTDMSASEDGTDTYSSTYAFAVPIVSAARSYRLSVAVKDPSDASKTIGENTEIFDVAAPIAEISSGPADIYVNSPHTFSATIKGLGANPRYVWSVKKDTADAADVSNPWTPDEAGSYTVTLTAISTEANTTASATDDQNFTVKAEPVFTVTPDTATLGAEETYEGQAVTFSVAPPADESADSFNYAWVMDTDLDDPDDDTDDITVSENVDAAKATYSFTSPAPDSQNADKIYTVNVTITKDGTSLAITKIFNFTIVKQTELTIADPVTDIYMGENVALSLESDLSTLNLPSGYTITWTAPLDWVEVDDGDNTATTATFTTPYSDGTAIIRVSIQNSEGTTIASGSKEVEIERPIMESLSIDSEFFFKLADGTKIVKAGVPMTLTATSKGFSNPVYVWSDDYSPIDNQSAATYTFTPSTGKQKREVLARERSEDGWGSHYKVIEFHAAELVFQRLPSEYTEGKELTFSVKLEGLPDGKGTDFTFGWWVDGTEITDQTGSTFLYTPPADGDGSGIRFQAKFSMKNDKGDSVFDETIEQTIYPGLNTEKKIIYGGEKILVGTQEEGTYTWKIEGGGGDENITNKIDGTATFDSTGLNDGEYTIIRTDSNNAERKAKVYVNILTTTIWASNIVFDHGYVFGISDKMYQGESHLDLSNVSEATQVTGSEATYTATTGKYKYEFSFTSIPQTPADSESEYNHRFSGEFETGNFKRAGSSEDFPFSIHANKADLIVPLSGVDMKIKVYKAGQTESFVEKTWTLPFESKAGFPDSVNDITGTTLKYAIDSSTEYTDLRYNDKIYALPGGELKFEAKGEFIDNDLHQKTYEWTLTKNDDAAGTKTGNTKSFSYTLPNDFSKDDTYHLKMSVSSGNSKFVLRNAIQYKTYRNKLSAKTFSIIGINEDQMEHGVYVAKYKEEAKFKVQVEENGITTDFEDESEAEGTVNIQWEIEGREDVEDGIIVALDGNSSLSTDTSDDEIAIGFKNPSYRAEGFTLKATITYSDASDEDPVVKTATLQIKHEPVWLEIDKPELYAGEQTNLTLKVREILDGENSDSLKCGLFFEFREFGEEDHSTLVTIQIGHKIVPPESISETDGGWDYAITFPPDKNLAQSDSEVAPEILGFQSQALSLATGYKIWRVCSRFVYSEINNPDGKKPEHNIGSHEIEIKSPQVFFKASEQTLTGGSITLTPTVSGVYGAGAEENPQEWEFEWEITKQREGGTVFSFAQGAEQSLTEGKTATLYYTGDLVDELNEATVVASYTFNGETYKGAVKILAGNTDGSSSAEDAIEREIELVESNINEEEVSASKDGDGDFNIVYGSGRPTIAGLPLYIVKIGSSTGTGYSFPVLYPENRLTSYAAALDGESGGQGISLYTRTRIKKTLACTPVAEIDATGDVFYAAKCEITFADAPYEDSDGNTFPYIDNYFIGASDIKDRIDGADEFPFAGWADLASPYVEGVDSYDEPGGVVNQFPFYMYYLPKHALRDYTDNGIIDRNDLYYALGLGGDLDKGNNAVLKAAAYTEVMSSPFLRFEMKSISVQFD